MAFFPVLSEEMAARGVPASHETVRSLLKEADCTIQSCKRALEGGDDPDRGAQFGHIA